MRRAERVVFALGALGEARQAAALAQRADAVAPAGQDLVRIGLVADVPDQPVARRVEHVMQRHGQLDHAETGAQMAAGHRDRVDRLGCATRRRPAGARSQAASAGPRECEWYREGGWIRTKGPRRANMSFLEADRVSGPVRQTKPID